MSTIIHLLLLLWSVCVCVSSTEEIAVDRGFGEQYNWRTMPQAFDEAGVTKKPIMVIVHKSWCRACKSLKKIWAENTELLEPHLDNFILVNLQNTEVDLYKKTFNVDGEYIPRIFFLDYQGTVDETIYNIYGNESHKYFYYDLHHVIMSMKVAADRLTGQKVPKPKKPKKPKQPSRSTLRRSKLENEL